MCERNFDSILGDFMGLEVVLQFIRVRTQGPSARQVYLVFPLDEYWGPMAGGGGVG